MVTVKLRLLTSALQSARYKKLAGSQDPIILGGVGDAYTAQNYSNLKLVMNRLPCQGGLFIINLVHQLLNSAV